MREPVLIEVGTGWSPRQIPALARACDGACVIVAAAEVESLLRAAGHRGPIERETTAAEAWLDAWTPDTSPRIEGTHLTTGNDTRRRTRLAGECWTSDEIRRRIELAKPIIPSSWDGYVAAHGERFVRTMSLVPAAPPGARALDASAFPLSVRLLDELGYWVAGTLFAEDRDAMTLPPSGFWVDANMRAEVWYDAERHRLPCDESMFDLVLAGEIIEHMPADPVQLLVEFNRVLRHGGLLVLTTPNIVSRHSIAQALNGLHPFNYPLFDRFGSIDRHHQEFTPTMLAAMVRRAGFHLERLTTADVWFPDEPDVRDLIERGGYSTAMRGDSLFVVARKVSAFVDRTPPGIYTGEQPTWELSRRVQPRRS
jgi:SAM-dependent methyltransferase